MLLTEQGGSGKNLVQVKKNQTITYDHLFVCERLYLASLLKGNFLTICEKEVRIMVNMMEVYQFHNILMILWIVIY